MIVSEEVLYLERFAESGPSLSGYRFDLDDYTHSLVRFDGAHEQAPRFAGFADERSIGLLKRRSVFVALYVLRDVLWLYLDRRLFSWPSDLRASRTTVMPFVKSFQVSRDHAIWECRYWYSDGAEWDRPDILGYISTAVESPERVAETVCILRARQAGRRLEEYVAGRDLADDISEYLRHAHQA